MSIVSYSRSSIWGSFTTSLTNKSLLVSIRNFTIIVFINSLLFAIEVAPFIFIVRFLRSQLKFSDIKYQLQYLKYHEIKYEFKFCPVTKEWTYNKIKIDTKLFVDTLDAKCVCLTKNDTYYYSDLSCLIKVVVNNNMVTYHVPDTPQTQNYINHLNFLPRDQ